MNELERVRALRPHYDELDVRAGDELATEGSLCHQYFVVVEGTLETCREGVRGELSAGESFGWAAMRNRGVNDASVRAMTDARLLVMGHEQFRAVTALEDGRADAEPLDGWRRLRGSLPGAARMGPTPAS